MQQRVEQQFAEALPDAVIALDLAGNICWWNQIAADMFALTEAEVGAAITSILSDGDFAAYLASASKEAHEFPSPRNPRARISVMLMPFGEDKKLLLGKDITHTYLLEKMREDFVANVSHELRTPLTVITGYLEMLIAQNVSPETQGIFLQMQSQADRMLSLIADLLLLSRLEIDAPQQKAIQQVNVTSMLKSICESAVPMDSKVDYTFHLDLDEQLTLLGQQDELHSAFSNLIVNAVRYSPEGGDIYVTWAKADDKAIMSVRDSGVGVEAKKIPRLTERFYRVDKGRSRAVGGTGLGLAIVKHVLIRHGASLQIESEFGQGSMFSCIFTKDKIKQ